MVPAECFLTTRVMFSLIGAWFVMGVDRGVAEGSEEPDCPKTCFCNVASKIVYCSRRGLSSIPEAVPLDSLQLNLNGNQMKSPIIKRSNLSHLASLEHLYLSECAVEEIEVGAFGNLPNLKWLDLSNNQIKAVHERTFQGLRLQHLFLNGNRNLQLVPESFEGLDTMGLYLHDCSISRLRPDVLAPLEHSLKNLWLNGNELERLDRKFEEMFTKLQHLRLGTNPLQCSCDAVWLKEFFDRNSDVFRGSLPPSCLSPRSLKGRYFNELSLFDLRCQMPQFTSIDGFFEVDFGRLRCVASGEPAPVLYWIQPSGKTSKFLPLNEFDDDSSQNEALLSLKVGETDRTHLSGMYICIANNEAGNVTLSITVPWPPQSLTPPVITPLATTPNIKTDPTLDLLVIEGRPKFSTMDTSTSSAHLESKLLGDSLKRLRRSSVAPSGDTTMGAPYKQFERLDVQVKSTFDGQDNERLFTVGELTWAVVGTHLLTLLLCVLMAVVCHERRKNREQKLSRSNMQSMDYCNDEVIVYDKTSESKGQAYCEDPALSESVYLNSLRHHRFKYYMDSSPISSEHPMINR